MFCLWKKTDGNNHIPSLLKCGYLQYVTTDPTCHICQGLIPQIVYISTYIAVEKVVYLGACPGSICRGY